MCVNGELSLWGEWGGSTKQMGERERKNANVGGRGKGSRAQLRWAMFGRSIFVHCSRWMDGWMDDACLASLKGKKEDSIGITTDCHWDIPAGAIGDEAKQ